MFLIGDIGGTNARLGYSEDGETLQGITVFSTARSSSLSELIVAFQEKHAIDSFAKACIAIAAPVHQGRASLTNGSWIAREAEVSFPLKLVNDLEAAARGLIAVPSKERIIIQEGGQQGDLSLVIGIGTGLGMAILDPTSQKVYSTEAGHSNLSPFSPSALSTWEILWRKKGRVRVEDVVSGTGLENLLDIYVSEELHEADRGKAAGQILLEEKYSGCSDALDFFISSLGSFLGDQIVAHNASSVFLCGGVAQKIERLLSWDYFWDHLGNKSPMNRIVNNAQIELISSSQLGLLGALNIAKSFT